METGQWGLIQSTGEIELLKDLVLGALAYEIIGYWGSGIKMDF